MSIQSIAAHTAKEIARQVAGDFGAKGDWSIQRLRWSGGLSDGVEEIVVDNGKLKFSVLPTRGMGIGKARVGDLEIGWKSPVNGPVHPQFVPVGEPSGLGWLMGFDELLVRCGLESNGAPDFDPKTNRLTHPLHGRIGNLPAKQVDVGWDDATGEIVVRGVVDEIRFHFLKLRLTATVRTKPGSGAMTIVDEIENLSASPAEAQMLYHWNFGLPLLDAGSRVVCAAKTVVPRNADAAKDVATWDSYRAPEPGRGETVYLLDLAADAEGQTEVLLKNAHGAAGVSLGFSRKQLPCMTIWKNETSEVDGYVTGLEPGTNFPNPRSFEGKQGRVIKLGAKGKHTLAHTLTIHPDGAGVAAAEKRVAALAGGTKPKLFDKPQETWCAP